MSSCTFTSILPIGLLRGASRAPYRPVTRIRCDDHTEQHLRHHHRVHDQFHRHPPHLPLRTRPILPPKVLRGLPNSLPKMAVLHLLYPVLGAIDHHPAELHIPRAYFRADSTTLECASKKSEHTPAAVGVYEPAAVPRDMPCGGSCMSESPPVQVSGGAVQRGVQLWCGIRGQRGSGGTGPGIDRWCAR